MTHHYTSLYDQTQLTLTPTHLSIVGEDATFTIRYSPLDLRDLIEGGASTVDGLRDNYTADGLELWVELPDGDAPELCSDTFCLRTTDILHIKGRLAEWGHSDACSVGGR